MSSACPAVIITLVGRDRGYGCRQRRRGGMRRRGRGTVGRMTEPTPQTPDNTRKDAPGPSGLGEPGVRGGDAADRMDSPGAGSGGVPAAGADGVTGAREDLRKDLGERSAGMGTEEGGDLQQAAAIGETDDPQGGSIQERGSRPA